MFQRLEPGHLMNSIDQLSTVQLAAYCLTGLIGAAWFGIIFLKPFIGRWLQNRGNSNDLVNYASGAFSLCYGLLLSLLSVSTYQNSARIQATIDNEASSIASLYRTVSSYPAPLGGELQFLLRDYTLYVINKDWPAHRLGKVWNGGALRLQVIQQDILSFEPENRAQQLLQQQSITFFNQLNDTRQQRLTGVRTAIPGVLWYVVAVGALINVTLLWMLDMGLAIHLILGGIISFSLGIIIFLILAMDRPLQGSVSITPEAYESMYALVMRWDERT
jgi:Protein of unknown function (DUF4239)